MYDRTTSSSGRCPASGMKHAIRIVALLGMLLGFAGTPVRADLIGNPSPAEGYGPHCYNKSVLDPLPAKWMNSCPWVDEALVNAGFTTDNNWTFRYNDAQGDDFALSDGALKVKLYNAWVVNEPTVKNTRGGDYEGRDKYQNKDCGGAIFYLEYDAVGLDPTANIHWIQAYNQRLGAGQPYTTYLDNWKEGKTNPWYDDGGAAGDDWFLDTPLDVCLCCTALGGPCDFETDVEFQVFLAVDNTVVVNGVTKHVVDIYEGYWWGYEYSCIPAPAALLLGIIGLAFVNRARRSFS